MRIGSASNLLLKALKIRRTRDGVYKLYMKFLHVDRQANHAFPHMRLTAELNVAYLTVAMVMPLKPLKPVESVCMKRDTNKTHLNVRVEVVGISVLHVGTLIVSHLVAASVSADEERTRVCCWFSAFATCGAPNQRRLIVIDSVAVDAVFVC